MKRAGLAVLSVSVLAVAFPSVAHAQATRTWVSGVGDDANPCSRTAPCKTFAGSISKTAPAGEIDTLDPGGFGALTITKSIVIDGYSGLAGVLVSGTNGFVIAAGATDVVILRNLDINGIGSGLSGIVINSAGDVRVENCKIYGFTQRGIVDNRTAGDLAVANTVVSDNTQTGILALGSGSTLSIHIDHVQMHNNGNSGFAITGGTKATVTNSSATSNAHGFYADTNAVMDLDDSTAFANSGNGILVLSGAVVRLYNSTVSANATGLNASGGTILSYGLNRIAGNTAGNGPATAAIPLQ